MSNQQIKIIADLWDGSLRCDFRRTSTDEMMIQWQEFLVIATTLELSHEEDQLIWQYYGKKKTNLAV